MHPQNMQGTVLYTAVICEYTVNNLRKIKINNLTPNEINFLLSIMEQHSYKKHCSFYQIQEELYNVNFVFKQLWRAST